MRPTSRRLLHLAALPLLGLGLLVSVLAVPVGTAAADSPSIPLVPAGYWLVGSDGGVFSFGDASFHGSMGGQALDAPIVGIAAGPIVLGGATTGSGRTGANAAAFSAGYWEVAADGGVFAFGSAQFYGSLAGQALNAPIVGIRHDRPAGLLAGGCRRRRVRLR